MAVDVALFEITYSVMNFAECPGSGKVTISGNYYLRDAPNTIATKAPSHKDLKMKSLLGKVAEQYFLHFLVPS